jgi:hypothetical protein
METGFYGFDAFVRTVLIPALWKHYHCFGKLQSFCPVFFNTLSVWERDVINSSAWLKSVTTKIVSPPSAVKGILGILTFLLEALIHYKPLQLLLRIGASDCHCSQTLSSVKDSFCSPTLEPSLQSGDFCNPETSQLLSSHISSPPGYREPEDGESTLSMVLDSLIPFICGNDSNVKLPVYLGKSVIDDVAGKRGG